MQFLPVIFNIVTTIFAYTLLAVGVQKLYSIARDMSEIRKLLTDGAADRRTRSLNIEPVLRE